MKPGRGETGKGWGGGNVEIRKGETGKRGVRVRSGRRETGKSKVKVRSGRGKQVSVCV